MRTLIFAWVLLSLSLVGSSQDVKHIQKSWIKVSVENLTQYEIEPDTLYTRYTFDKSKIYISLYPGWDNYVQDWSWNKQKLTLGFSSFHLEELTDSSLVIRADGFRRYSFIAEDHLASQERYLDSIGIYNGKPLYKANNFITPRYLKGKSLRDVVQRNTDGYHIRKANQFYLTFIVTEEGRVENIQVIKGITEGFDNQISEQLQSTWKDWKPARFKSMPIQTQMFYEIRYLDSFIQ